ncbi:cellulase family glycosylhydrolase [Aquisphaera insulae]|uniref:cellulase family glycosylhydrolase n=1 Tax=Aquisphaera insulae TaxID=2712864 RepID=UPI00202E4574|nr:cellulase family glycosylhydrolase [Aquisphaera insulae]
MTDAISPRLRGAAPEVPARRGGIVSPFADRPGGESTGSAAKDNGLRRHGKIEFTLAFLVYMSLGLALIPPGRAVAQGSPTAQAAAAPELAVRGRHFVDPAGRVVILRGVNLSGDAKRPPFLPCSSPSDLDPLVDLGFNVVRMLFIWEAYEPVAGVYDDAYLGQLRSTAAAARARGMHVIVDIHQDGFSRFASRGAGDGFPRWAVSPRGTPSSPDNSDRCRNWPVRMATDPTTHRSFDDFFADVNGVRTRYLAMLGRVADAFATVPGVVGYDLLNEPWGDERTELATLYRDAAAVIRDRHPGAILFLEGHVTTNCGAGTRLPRPDFPGAAYAPHYYRPLTVLLGRWHGMTVGMNHAFSTMAATARTWDAPLFLGEFGVSAGARNGGDYVAAIYDRMDACLASGAQWNYSPRWNVRDRDGWNGEDFSILDSSRSLRPNFAPRPYPRVTAGLPTSFRFVVPRSGAPACLEFRWEHRPVLGTTELFLPSGLFPAGSIVACSDPTMSLRRDPGRQVLACEGTRSGPVRLTVQAPRIDP